MVEQRDGQVGVSHLGRGKPVAVGAARPAAHRGAETDNAALCVCDEQAWRVRRALTSGSLPCSMQPHVQWLSRRRRQFLPAKAWTGP